MIVACTGVNGNSSRSAGPVPPTEMLPAAFPPVCNERLFIITAAFYVNEFNNSRVAHIITCMLDSDHTQKAQCFLIISWQH